MQKYKDLRIKFSSSLDARNALNDIKEKCNIPQFLYSEKIDSQYQSDCTICHILVDIKELPKAVLVLYVVDNLIKVINIVPYQHSCDIISKREYNIIIDSFNNMIVHRLFSNNIIELSKENITLEELLPNSYKYLDRWAHCPGAPHNPFSHTNDLERWFSFICNLHTSNETLSSGDLEQWLIEDLQWDENIVAETIIRYETELDLLEFYDNQNR